MKTEFPNTLLEAVRYFSDLDICLKFLVSWRWPNGIKCPFCGYGEHSFISTRRVWKCKDCKKQFSVKVGTILEDSPIGLDKWMLAIWLIASAKNGISSYEIHRSIGVTQKTAWFLLHRIREAMENGTIEKFSGIVEADETYVGGLEKNKHSNKKTRQGRGAVGKTCVMGVLQRGTEETHSKIRANVIAYTDAGTLENEIIEKVQEGSKVFTDTYPGYDNLPATGYIHDLVNHKAKEYVRGEVYTNGVENFWCLTKRMIKGTYVSIDPTHLDRYIEEEQFRFNTRQMKDGERFNLLISQISGCRLTWKALTK